MKYFRKQNSIIKDEWYSSLVAFDGKSYHELGLSDFSELYLIAKESSLSPNQYVKKMISNENLPIFQNEIDELAEQHEQMPYQTCLSNQLHKVFSYTSFSFYIKIKLTIIKQGININKDHIIYPKKLGILTPFSSAIDFTIKFGAFPIYVKAPIKTDPIEIANNCLVIPGLIAELIISAFIPTASKKTT